MTIPELLQTLAGKVVNHVTCTFEQYQGITDKDSNTLYYATDRKAIFKGAIKLCDLTEIGDLGNLETSNSTNLVSAINEVNQKATNNQGGGVINDSTISPFAGFLPNGTTIIDSSSFSTNGEVLYDSATNRFVWKDLSGTFVQYYANWFTSYLYNTTSDSSTSAKDDKLFSYNDKHYMVINGTLQDISALDNNGNMTTAGIVKLSDSYTGGADNYGVNSGIAATPKAVASVATAARNYTDNKALQSLENANQYTDNQIATKIQLVNELPENPIAGVLYCIPE